MMVTWLNPSVCPADDDEMIGDDALDLKELTKKDIHTINEQRRRDTIKVGKTGRFKTYTEYWFNANKDVCSDIGE